MRRFTARHLMLLFLTVPLMFGYTTEERPTGDTKTVTAGNVIYADEGSTIQVYLETDNEYQLLTSIETRAEPQATHDSDRRRKKHRHSFACSCEHSHGHGHHDDRDNYDPYDDGYGNAAMFAVSGSVMIYVYESTFVVTLDISTASDPIEVSRVDAGWEIESIEVVQGEFIVSGVDGGYVVETENNPNVLRAIDG